jgi:hypothetical protein
MKNYQKQTIEEVASSIYDKLLSRKQRKQTINFFDPNFCNINRIVKEAAKKNKKVIVVTFENEIDLQQLTSPLREKNLKSLC